MKTLYIEPTQNTPAVNFDSKKEVLHLIGRSIPEDPEELYAPVQKWVRGYLSETGHNLEFQIVLEYINSGSAKFIMETLRELEKFSGESHDILVKWFYEKGDESILELGEHFKESVSIPFKLVEVP